MNKKDIKILLIDDEPDIIEIVKYNLNQEGYDVYTAEDGVEGFSAAKKIVPHLIISDIMMPKMDGIELCEKIRDEAKLSNVMIIFLTARGEDYSQVAGFEAGADDYITKPVKPKILVSKVKSLLRRFQYDTQATSKSVQPSKNSFNKIIQVNDLIIDNEIYQVTKGDQKMILPKKEFELLQLLASRPDKVFKREEIMNIVWGNEIIIGGRTIDVHIRKLRTKIGDKHFATVKGIGYKYIP